MFNLVYTLLLILFFGLIIIGDGHLYSELMELIKSQDLEKKVLIKKSVSNHKIQDYYKSATLFALAYDTELEGTPIPVLEAMASGLGLVLSEQSTANLDFTQPFITIIPDHKLDDTKFLKKKIEENRRDSLNIRNWIREYCQTNFDWSIIIQRYKEIINNI